MFCLIAYLFQMYCIHEMYLYIMYVLAIEMHCMVSLGLMHFRLCTQWPVHILYTVLYGMYIYI